MKINGIVNHKKKKKLKGTNNLFSTPHKKTGISALIQEPE